MKNLNLFEKLWEHGRTLRRVGLVLVMCLIAIPQAWAYNLEAGYLKYTFNGSESTFTVNDNDNYTLDKGELTGTFALKGMYLKSSTGTGDTWTGGKMGYTIYSLSIDGETSEEEILPVNNRGYGYNGNAASERQDDWEGTINIASNTSNSGIYYFKFYFVSYFGYGNDIYKPSYGNHKEIKYTVMPPTVSSYTVTATGKTSGSGTYADPYIVPYGGTLQLDLSGASQGHTDTHSSIQYSVDNSSWGTETSNTRKVISNVTKTNEVQNWVVYAKYHNSDDNLDGTTNSKTIYYKAATPTAGTVFYKFKTKTSDLGNGSVCAAASTEYPQTTSNSLSALAGGALSAYGTGSLTQLKFNDDSYDMNGSNNTWLIVKLDCPIASGDVVRYINYGDKSATINVQSTRGTNTTFDLAGSGTKISQTITIPDAFIGATTLYLTRKAGTAYLTSFEIIRPYTLTLNAHDGSVSPSSLKVPGGEATSVLPHASYTNYWHKGWFASASGGAAVSNPYTATSSTTLHAQYDPCSSKTGSIYKFIVKNTLTAGSPFTTGTLYTIGLTKGDYLSELYGGTLDAYGKNTYLTNTTSAFTLANTGSYLLVTLDCPLRDGDQIKSIVSGSSVAITTSSSRSTTNTLATGTNTVAIPAGFKGASTIYIWKNSSDGSISHFEIIRPAYTVTAVTSTGTTTCGTVSAGASSLAQGGTTTITAVPADGYQVASWAVSGTGASIDPSGTSNSTTTELTMGSANATVTVTFEAIPSCSATAEAGANKSTTVGVGVAMSATAASSGHTGAWSIKDSSPSTDAGQLGTTSSNTMTFTPNQSGTYTLIWTVTDNSDGSCFATDEVDVVVTAPSSDATFSSVTIGGETATISGSAGSYTAKIDRPHKGFSLTQDVTFTTNDANATVKLTNSSGEVVTSVDDHDFSSANLVLYVLAEDGSTSATYTLSITTYDKYLVYLTTSASPSENIYRTISDYAEDNNYKLSAWNVSTSLSAANMASYYDLVILAEAPSSSNTTAQAVGSAIGNVPVLSFKGFMFGKTNWPTGAGYNPGTGSSALKVITTKTPCHDIFDGLSLTGDSKDITILSSDPASGKNGVQLISGVSASGWRSLADKEISSTTYSALLEYVGTSGSNKALVIPISNDACGVISSATETIIGNAIDYLLDNSALYTINTTKTISAIHVEESDDSDITYNGDGTYSLESEDPIDEDDNAVTVTLSSSCASYSVDYSDLTDGYGDVTVTVTSESGATGTYTLTVTKSCTAPTIGSQPANVSICSGSTTTLTVSSITGGTTPYSFKWYDASDDSEVTTGSGYTTASFTTPTLNAAASYYCIVTEAGGCTTQSNTAAVSMKTDVSITTQPSDVDDAVVGSASTLTIVAAGTSPTYQWYTCDDDKKTNADDLDGETDATLSITPAAAGVTYYYCVVTGDCGTETSNVVSITAKNAISPTLSYASISIAVGDVTAAPTVSGNTGSGSVSYSSNATDVATVASDGKVTAKTVGSATITATIAETSDYWGNTATATFTIGKGSISPSLSYASVGGTTLAVGATSTGSPTVSGNTGDGTVTYSVSASSPLGCATVNSETGVVTAVHPGTATITASIAQTTNYNSGSATASFTITKADISPTLSYASTSLVVGDETDEPTVDGNPGSGTVTYEVTSASPSGCITVDEDGKVTAVKAGSATVTATIAATDDYNSGTATADFTVSACSPTTLVKTVLTGYSEKKCTHTTTGTYKADPSIDLPSTTQSATIGGNSVTGYKLGSSGHYFYVNLSGAYLKAGDIIKVVITQANDAYKVEGVAQTILDLYYGSNSYLNTIIDVSAAGEYSYTLTASDISTIGASVSKVGVYRPSSGRTQNPYVYSIEVTRPCAATTYSVTYEDGGATGGEVPEDASEYEEGATVTVLGNTGDLEKDGYSFGGWSDDVNTYSDGNTFSMPAEDVTLTAVWNPEDYTITYHLNGASWAGGYSAPAEYTVGIGATLPVAGNMTNTGYSFNGWKNNSGLTGDNITAIGTSDYGNKEFWAKWTENTYTITYNKNGGSGDNMENTVGRYVRLEENTYTAPDGKIFAEWNTASDGTGDRYRGGEDIELEADMTLYAIWATDYEISWGNVQIGGAGETKTPNIGGGNYTITASVSSWTGELAANMVSASDGVVISSVAVDNSSSPKTATITFGVGAGVEGSSIELTLSVPAQGIYSAKESTQSIDIDRCTGSSGGSDGVLFSAEFKDSGLGNANVCSEANEPFTFTTEQLKSAAVGGTISAYTTATLAHLAYNNNSVALKGSDGVIQIDLDNAINTNDLFAFINKNGSSSDAYLRHTNASNTTDQITLSGYGTEKKVMLPAGFNDKKQLFIVRNSTNFLLHKAAVVRPAFLMLLDNSVSTGDLSGEDVEMTTSNYLSIMKGGRVYYTTSKSGDIQIEVNGGKKYLKLAKTTGYLKVVLDEELAEGDIIGYDTHNSSSEIVFTTTAERATTIRTSGQLYTVESSSPLKGVSTFYIWYNSSATPLRGLQIARSGVAGGGGGTDKITPTLTWDADLSGGVNVSVGTADFTHSVTQDVNSLGAVTYSSSNTSVATVTAAGKVHIVGAAGAATITATMAASGCYQEATASYNIVVEDNCTDEAGTISARDLECEGTELTVSGHTTTASTTYQWYKDGESMGGSYTAAKCTVTVAGEYYVVVTNTGDGHCAMASTNTVEVEAAASGATAEKIVDQWYVKNGRRTPDVELVQTTGATGFIVKIGDTPIWNSDGTVTTGFGGCGFHLGENGIIYLNGTKDNGDAPSGLTGDGETEILKITATGCGGNASELSITIHKQVPLLGDRPSVAFVVDGKVDGGFDEANASHSTSSALYQYLDHGTDASGAFDLTAQNIYSTIDEQAIREHYSQFDAIIITDDPSTKKNPENRDGDYYKTHGYVNAFGTMIDVRPILSMEAFVSRLANWGAKGVAGDPSSPNPRPYEMRLQCKDHEIYSGLPAPEEGTHVWTEIIDGDEYRHVMMVDKTKSPYAGLADDEKTSGAGEVPALQGFLTEAMGDLLGLGVISDGTLQAGVERQEEPAARMMLLGLNAKALPTALTEEGKKVIENALTYLLKTNMEEVDDCSNFFTGEDGTNWNNVDNWSKKTLPNYETKVRIMAECELSGETVHVAQVDIVTSGASGKMPGGTCSGHLTIQPTAALIVDGKIRTAQAPHFAANDLMPTTEDDLTIYTNEDNQAALIFENDKAETKATVNLYSLGRKDEAYQYQYFAVPMEYVDVDPWFANDTYGKNIYTYVYSEASSGWVRRGFHETLYAFEGLGVTTKSALATTYTMAGNLTSTATKEIPLTHAGKGLNLIGNSWMAPIQIEKLAEDNSDANITQTVYIYCAGRDAEEGVSISGDTETPGQWIAIPFNAAGFAEWKASGKLSVIPAMQAFEIKVADESVLTLDYDKVVRGSTNSLNEKLRAPSRSVTENEVTMTIIRVADSKTHTDLSLFEGEHFSEAFDNGWEAEYLSGDGRSARLYALMDNKKMAVMAKPDYEGTVVGFAPGKETEYTFSFMGEDDGYYLNDIKEQNSVQIMEGETYTFTYEDGDSANRFYISRTPINAPAVTTGMESLDIPAAKAQKIIFNDKLYILLNGRVYSADGAVVK